MRDKGPLGVYIHVPYCRVRCAYCDFAIVVGRLGTAPDFERAALAEMAEFARVHGRRSADSVHLGGGTPSRVDPGVIGRLLAGVREHFVIAPGAEIALEANLEDLTTERLAAWRGLGVTRLAVGVQALDPRGLEAIGRPGATEDAADTLAEAARSGIRSIGADFIFGRPGQQVADWEREATAIAQLPVAHLSLYALELDGKSPLRAAIERGRRPAPDPDSAAEMYEVARAAAEKRGFRRYELSNFAREGHESRHNLKYWRDEPYAGFGPAAASYVDGRRWTNPRRLAEFVALADQGFAARKVPPYDPDRCAGEAIVFGLRMDAGIDLDTIARRHGPEPVRRRGPGIETGVRRGLLVREGPRIRLAERAVLIAHEALVDLL